MTKLVLLLSLWPFHHKKPASEFPQWQTMGCRPASNEGCSTCTKSGNVWFYTEEGVIGIGASCDAAKKDWNSAHIDPIRMSRA